jgi:hypothetical protein
MRQELRRHFKQKEPKEKDEPSGEPTYVQRVHLLGPGSLASYLSSRLPIAASITADQLVDLALQVGVDQLLPLGGHWRGAECQAVVE